VKNLIEKGATTLQLRYAKPREHESTCSSAMVTCDMPLLKGNILWLSLFSKRMLDVDSFDKITALI
jgi:hypothetical protein